MPRACQLYLLPKQAGLMPWGFLGSTGNGEPACPQVQRSWLMSALPCKLIGGLPSDWAGRAFQGAIVTIWDSGHQRSVFQILTKR